MSDQEIYFYLPSLSDSPSAESPPRAAQPLSSASASGSARCTESDPLSRSETTAGLSSSTHASYDPTLDSTPVAQSRAASGRPASCTRTLLNGVGSVGPEDQSKRMHAGAEKAGQGRAVRGAQRTPGRRDRRHYEDRDGAAALPRAGGRSSSDCGRMMARATPVDHLSGKENSVSGCCRATCCAALHDE
jgi:hypothetical protein